MQKLILVLGFRCFSKVNSQTTYPRKEHPPSPFLSLPTLFFFDVQSLIWPKFKLDKKWSLWKKRFNLSSGWPLVWPKRDDCEKLFFLGVLSNFLIWSLPEEAPQKHKKIERKNKSGIVLLKKANVWRNFSTLRLINFKTATLRVHQCFIRLKFLLKLSSRPLFIMQAVLSAIEVDYFWTHFTYKNPNAFVVRIHSQLTETI